MAYPEGPMGNPQANIPGQPQRPGQPNVPNQQGMPNQYPGQQPGYQQAQQPYQPYQQPHQQQQPQQQQPPQQPYTPMQPQQPAQQAQAGAVRGVTQASAVKHADKQYSKGARRGGAWRILFLLSLAVLIVALSCVGYIMYTYWAGQQEYDELAQEYMQVDDPEGSLTSFHIDWDGLRAINPGVVGWVYFPGTVINYPIVWRENDDNYYLKRSFGDNSAGTFGAEYGTVMLAGVNSPEWTDQVNVIYGHHLNNGSMFSAFADLQDTDVFNANRIVYVLTPVGNFKLSTFAVDKVLGSDTSIVIPNFETRQELTDYIQARIDASLVTPDPPAPAAASVKQVFAFSTCSQPDHEYRIITFSRVEGFLPAGSDAVLEDSLMDDESESEVLGMVDERLL